MLREEEREEMTWKLRVLRDHLKRMIGDNSSKDLTLKPLEALGMCELIHESIHRLDPSGCGLAGCEGVDQEVLTRFIDWMT
jgi:hypothetical protein